jgi:hypothetical protein
MVSTFAEELGLFPSREQRRDDVTHALIDFSEEDLVAALVLRAGVRRCPDLSSHRSRC